MSKSLFLAVLLMTPTVSLAIPAAAKKENASTAQQTQLMKKFAGSWAAVGTSFGLPSRSKMKWTTDLAGKFYRVEYRIDMDRDGKTQTFLGHGYYRKDATDGFWADTGGDLHPMATSYSDNMLKTIWGKAGQKQGRSHYEMRDDGTIEVKDWILSESGWREFNRTLFRRAD